MKKLFATGVLVIMVILSFGTRKEYKESTTNTIEVVEYQKSVKYTKKQLKAYAKKLVLNKYGWSLTDFNSLVKLWNKESGWNANAHNKRSGAHGIPQALPARKMKSAGKDYYTNGKTQIRWGLKYILARYGSPLKAWNHSKKKGWY